MHELKSNSL